ncbi:MAG: lactoylglutathione lyase [Pseudomonadota bacterium]|nr:lactoylglutathione lyase [Pseudomonadota bacterium]
MPQMIFVNLPVADLDASMAFYEAIGATNDPDFTDETAAMMRFSEAVNVMLLTHDKWRQFTTKAIPDARTHAQVLLALSRDSREAVDAITADAAKAGAVMDPTPQQDYGWMYGRSFEDPDGHIWEVSWMDVAAAISATAETQGA